MKHIKIVLSLMILSVLMIIPKYKAYTDSFTYGNVGIDQIGFTGQFSRYKDNWGGQRFNNYKDGEIYFTFSTSSQIEIYGAKVYDAYNRAYPCNIGTTTGYNDNGRQMQTFSAMCKSDFNGTYFNKIEIYGYSQIATSVIIWPNTLSYYSYDTPKDIITAIQSASSTQAINEMKEQQRQQHEEEMNYNENNIEQPNQDDYDDYTQNEETLFEMTEDTDTSVIQIALDIITTTWIWTTITTLLQTHTLVFSMIISILSIGIIKHALGR